MPRRIVTGPPWPISAAESVGVIPTTPGRFFNGRLGQRFAAKSRYHSSPHRDTSQSTWRVLWCLGESPIVKSSRAAESAISVALRAIGPVSPMAVSDLFSCAFLVQSFLTASSPYLLFPLQSNAEVADGEVLPSAAQPQSSSNPVNSSSAESLVSHPAFSVDPLFVILPRPLFHAES
ncbi:unnamed protein product [Phytophthora fragariaefolia]|uniref:Unnamed protein product n=1 Tax=Phytophthora fragariaefolia TaxID=1490495 RepID=A0A9W6Y0S7_9STRA|nr:unnamed protein product [Phytophthora fragariaefolia]